MVTRGPEKDQQVWKGVYLGFWALLSAFANTSLAAPGCPLSPPATPQYLQNQKLLLGDPKMTDCLCQKKRMVKIAVH